MKKKILDLIVKSEIEIPSQMIDFYRCEEIQEFPFKIDPYKGLRGIRSQFSLLLLQSPEINFDIEGIACFLSFVEMIDIIHTCLSIHHPIIIEGISGKGKHIAIKLLANALEYDLISISISSATTIEEIFCKIMPERRNGNLGFILFKSRLLQEIDSETATLNKIIIIEDLHQASPAVLDSLAPLFDPSKNSLFLRNEDIIKKVPINLIGFYDSTHCVSLGIGLPNSIKHSTIFFTAPSYSQEDF
jgi:hypothetical protein